MRAARERRYLIGVSIFPSPGLMRSTRRGGRTVGFPTRPPFRPSMSWQHSWSRRSWLTGGSKRAGWCATRDMATRPPSWNAWPGRDCGTWQRFHGTRRSGHSWKPTGRRSVRVRAVGCPRKPLSRKGPAPRRERLYPSSPAKVPLEELAKQWPASRWQRFRRL
jgi:hypothetical protein